MALKSCARGTSLEFTGATATSPLTDIISYDFSESESLAEFLDGTARVVSHYKGTHTATIQVETHDIDTWSDFSIGEVVTNLILTIEGAIESTGTETGDDALITFSKAVVSEKGNLTHTNEDSSPATATITFKLHRAAADTSDPTVTVAASV